jgi:hypothetical protein
MKQRLNADFINASAEEFFFIFSQTGKNLSDSNSVKAFTARV